MAENGHTEHIEIPKKCNAGVVVDEGPNFRVEIEEVDVPEYVFTFECTIYVLIVKDG